MRLSTVTRTAALVAGAAALSGITVGMSMTASTKPLSPPVGATVPVMTPHTNMALLNSLSVSMPKMPSANASLQTWTAWSQVEARWAKTGSTPLSAALTAQGERLVQFSLIPNVPVYGAPAGVTETGVSWVSAPATKAGVAASTRQSSTPLGQPAPVANATPTVLAATTDPSTCAQITGPGEDCISANGSTITGSYEYLGSGSVTGHVEASGGGCPGTGGVNSPNVSLSYGGEVGAYFAEPAASNTWSSRFWRYDGGTSYSLWGTVCAQY